MRKSLMTLAFGTFGLGVSEFVMMGILPLLAKDFGVSIPTAGHLISSYALGVCVGAPLIVLVARAWRLKRILLFLMGIYTLAALAMALAPNYDVMLVMRFLAGMPHGAYFGVGSIVADKLSREGKSTFAVAVMCSGMTVANLIGIPLGTMLASVFSWRMIFGFSFLWGILTLLSIMKWIPELPPLQSTKVRDQFRFLKHPAPWLLIAATLLGNGGVFCWYSYITPLLTNVSGIASQYISFMMVLAGAGMVAGNLLGGKLSDKFGPGHTGRGIEIAIFVTLLLIFFGAHYPFLSVVLMVIATACLFGVSSPQQILLLRYSKGGELMGGAMVQLAFNLGNALGAFCGGLPVESGMGYEWTALVGACFAFVGIICYFLFCSRYEKRKILRSTH
ncbi:MAG: MFS transporter AraJ [Prevotellaceae bacterium]|nr:MFS transporter AraJ [Prevotellaceae bacterium]